MHFIRRILVAIVIAGLGLTGTALAAAPNCTGNVVIGEGDGRIVTNVPNQADHGVCFNDLIVDTTAEGANYGNHGQFVAHVARYVVSWTATKRISQHEAGELLLAAARSDVGRTIKVRVIAFNDFHGTLQSPGTFGVQAGGPGTEIVNQPAGGVDYLASYVAVQNTSLTKSSRLVYSREIVSAVLPDNQAGGRSNACPYVSDQKTRVVLSSAEIGAS